MSDTKTVDTLVSQVQALKNEGKITKEQSIAFTSILQVVATEDYVAKGLNPDMAKNAYKDGMITRGMFMKELNFWAFR